MIVAGVARPSRVLGRRGQQALVGGFLLLAGAARLVPGHLEDIESGVTGWVRTGTGLELLRALSLPGSTGVTVTVAVVLAVAVRRRCRPLAIAYPAAVGAGLLANVVLKFVVDRPRPTASLTGTALASFPSGHTIQVVVALGMLPPVLYVLTRQRWALVAATAVLEVGATGVGISRVALGAHWPTDVVGGVMVGLLLLLGAELLLDRLPRRWVPDCAGCAIHAPPAARGGGRPEGARL